MGVWKKCLLGDLVTFQRGHDLPKTAMSGGKYPVVGSNGIIGYHNEYTTASPSVTIGRSGNVGNPFIYYGKSWSHNTTLYIKEYKNTDPVFAYYFLKTLDLKQYAGGSAVPTLNRNHIQTLEVCVPEGIDEQKKIGKYLKLIDDQIQLNNQINKNLEQQLQAFFQKWFISNPSSSTWNIGTFSNIIESMIAGDWGKGSPQGNFTQQVYCIRGTDIPEVKAGNKGKIPTRYIISKNYATKHLVDGDVVIEISGGSPTQSTGRIAAISQSLLNRYDKGIVCTNFCKALKPKQGYSMFLYYYWQYLYSRNIFFSYENGTTGIKNLDIAGFIETEPIVLPPLELVIKFDDYCQSAFNMIFANGLESEQLSILRESLLPKLMSGEIDISEINT